jgi:endonuclease YncB( thermonuclease family)
VEAADEPEPTATTEPTDEPTLEPTAEPTDEPTAEPTLEPTQEPTTEPTATSEPTLEPTAEPTQPPTEEAATPDVTAEPTQTPSPSPTATIEPTTTPTEEPSPTPTPTAEPDFPGQEATLGDGELPAQVLSGGQFRYTIEAVIQAPTIDSVALTAVPGAEWLLLYVHAENWSDVDATLAPGGLQVLTYGDYGVASTFPDPVSTVIGQTLGLDPALGPADAFTLAPGDGVRMALAYLVLPGTTELQLTTGVTTMDLAPAVGQSVDIFDPGDPPASPDLVSGTVTRILDGQTVMVETEDGARARVRYLGVQAPIDSACYAQESINANAALTLGKTVYLERERKNRAPNSQIARDVWIVGDDGNLTLIAAVLAAEGSVVAAPVEPDVRFAGWIQAAADGAQFNGLGLWAACGGLQTPVPEPTETPAEEETPVAEIEPALLLKRLFI